MDRVTLAGVLRILRPDIRIYILHRLGPRECEIVAEGTVREIQTTRCVEVCGDNVVISLAMDAGERLERVPGEDAPTLVITIGRKETGYERLQSLRHSDRLGTDPGGGNGCLWTQTRCL